MGYLSIVNHIVVSLHVRVCEHVRFSGNQQKNVGLLVVAGGCGWDSARSAETDIFRLFWARMQFNDSDECG